MRSAFCTQYVQCQATLRLISGNMAAVGVSYQGRSVCGALKNFSVASLICTLFFAPLVRSSSYNCNMEAHAVAPDVVSVAPAVILDVSYNSGVKAECGNELTPTQVKDAPAVKWDAEPNVFYTLAMVDPDAPSRKDPKFREWEHWLVGNIPGNDVAKGDVLFAYVGSAPPKDTGLHRYIFLLYKQNGKIDFKEKSVPNTSGEGRPKFSIRTFADSYGLGNPIAGNLYQAQHDDYCAVVYKQLSG